MLLVLLSYAGPAIKLHTVFPVLFYFIHGPGSAERIRAPQYESGPRGTEQDSECRIRARRTNQGPAGRTRAPQDESGPRMTNLGSL